METKARYTLVGFFTLLGIILLIGAVLLFGKINSNNQWRYYIVEFHESVNGLSRGSSVLYSGLKIGEVTDLKLGSNPNIVYARVKVGNDVKIKKDVQARLQIVGITGQAAVAMSGGSGASPELEGDEDNPDLIVATPSALSKLLNGSDDMMSNFTETMIGVKKLFSDENIKHIGETLDNVAAITGVVAGQDNDIKQTMQNMNKLSKEASEAIISFKQLTKSTQKMLDSSGGKLTNSMTSTLNSIQKSADQLNSILSQNKSKLADGADGIQQIGPAVAEFKESISTLQGILKKFDNNPGGYLLEGNKLREFQP